MVFKKSNGMESRRYAAHSILVMQGLEWLRWRASCQVCEYCLISTQEMESGRCGVMALTGTQNGGTTPEDLPTTALRKADA